MEMSISSYAFICVKEKPTKGAHRGGTSNSNSESWCGLFYRDVPVVERLALLRCNAREARNNIKEAYSSVRKSLRGRDGSEADVDP
jgi:hypothetical protein